LREEGEEGRKVKREETFQSCAGSIVVFFANIFLISEVYKAGMTDGRLGAPPLRGGIEVN